jgi:hypothetical protein
LEVEASNLEIEDNKRLEIERIKLIDSKEKSLKILEQSLTAKDLDLIQREKSLNLRLNLISL